MAKKLNIVAIGTPVTLQLIVRLRACKFRPRLKAGMSRSEANDAIDAAFEEFITCLKNKGRVK